MMTRTKYHEKSLKHRIRISNLISGRETCKTKYIVGSYWFFNNTKKKQYVCNEARYYRYTGRGGYIAAPDEAALSHAG